MHPIFNLTNLHIGANLVIFLLYFAVFTGLIHRFSRKFETPSLEGFLMGLFFLLTGGAVAVSLYRNPSWDRFAFELTWCAVLALPALSFLYLRRRASIFTLGKDRHGFNGKGFDELKGEFLSMASHELRTPLSVITGFAEILVREKIGPLNDEQKRRVRKILIQGQRLNRIVDELLDLSRIRSGKVILRHDIFDFVPVLKACVDDHQIVCEQQKLILRDQVPDILPDVAGDLERVMQIIINLLNNAIKYTEQGGTITLSAFKDPSAAEVRVEVRDTGIGIAPADQAKVFEEFFRSAHPRARKFSGSGLGLAIVKQLVETQGGSVGLESAGLGKGSCFFFTLPVAKVPK